MNRSPRVGRGRWPFIHEWTIYDYLWTRCEENVLQLRIVVKDGRPLYRPLLVRVLELAPITGTLFPDIHEIVLEGIRTRRPAEVKFSTSLFNYHNSHPSKYKTFLVKIGLVNRLA